MVKHTHRCPSRTRPTAAFILLSTALIGGCVQPHDDLAMARAISADPSDRARTLLPEATNLPPLAAGGRDGRTISGLSRANWSSVKVTPTYLGLRTTKPYTKGPRYSTELARQRGEYPAITTVTDDTSEIGRYELVAEGFAAPGWALLDLLLLGPRLAMEPPWKPVAYETKNFWTPAPVAAVAPRGTGVITPPPSALTPSPNDAAPSAKTTTPAVTTTVPAPAAPGKTPAPAGPKP